ncbi:MAG: acetate--CoA ligase family protein [Rhodospirillales bacterium]|nr:acetate--CoA ligase family protein [Rhodospirillales bacterium]
MLDQTDKDVARALLSPRSVALIGASGDEGKNTARPLRYLRKHGFDGGVFPVNAGRAEVLGEKAWPDLMSAAKDAGGSIDHAYVMVPKAAVPQVIQDCAEAGVKVASIYSDGFAEAGEDGVRFQHDMVTAARAGGVRIIGPNSMGVVNVQTGMGMTTNAALETPDLIPGPFSVISQSGTALGALLSRGQARGFGFSKLLSIGNESDLSVGEVVDGLVDDPDTGAILLFLETLRRADDLARAARRAFDAGKPVIAYKLGRSDAGQRMAESHSGALAGPDEAATAFFRHHGILRVDTLEALLETPFLVMGRTPLPRPAGAKKKRVAGSGAKRVAVMTTTGGGASMVVDRLGLAGIDFADPPARVIERLSPLGIRVGGGSPVIDVTMVGARADVYGPTVGDLLEDDGNDGVICVVGSSAQFRPDVAVSPIIEYGQAGKPLAVFCVPEAGASLKALTDAGMAGFRTPESCADAVAACLNWTAPVPEAARNIPEGVLSLLADFDDPQPDEETALAVFEGLSIPCVQRRVLGAGDAPPDNLVYPVAAKVLSADIAHKTEAGGVVLNIADADALSKARASILENTTRHHPDAAIDGILVQPMETGLAEALVGYRLDPVAGPVVVVGAGGILTELYNDAAIRTAPVDRDTALEMIRDVKGLAVLAGYRGLPEGDLEALADVVVQISLLALVDDPGILEAEINPVMVRAKGEGAVAVDGLIVLDRSGS